MVRSTLVWIACLNKIRHKFKDFKEPSIKVPGKHYFMIGEKGTEFNFLFNGPSSLFTILFRLLITTYFNLERKNNLRE